MWHLFNAEDDVKLTVTVQNDNKHSLTYPDGTGSSAFSVERGCLIIIINDGHISIRHSDGSDQTAYVQVEFNEAGQPYVTFKMPAYDVICTDSWYKIVVDGNNEGAVYAKKQDQPDL